MTQFAAYNGNATQLFETGELIGPEVVERALAEAGERGGGVGPLGEGGSENGGGGLAIGWGRDHRAQGTVDAVRFSAMGDFV